MSTGIAIRTISFEDSAGLLPMTQGGWSNERCVLDDTSITCIDRRSLVAPKCMCKSTRGRKMKLILSPETYFRQFIATGSWVQHRRIEGWFCTNCGRVEEHQGWGRMGIVVERGRVTDILYENESLVPNELAHLIPEDADEWFNLNPMETQNE